MSLIKKAVEEALKKEKLTINHKQLENHPHKTEILELAMQQMKEDDFEPYH